MGDFKGRLIALYTYRGFVLSMVAREFRSRSLYGLPLISTEIGTGKTYVNEKDVTGLVVPPGDVEALRAAMERLHDDDFLCTALGQNARQRYETLFTADRMGEKYFRLIFRWEISIDHAS